MTDKIMSTTLDSTVQLVSPHNLVLDECDKLLAACQGRQILPTSEVINLALDISQAVRRSNDEYQKLLDELASTYAKYTTLLRTVTNEIMATPNV